MVGMVDGHNRVISIQPAHDPSGAPGGAVARALLSQIAEAVDVYIHHYIPEIIDIGALGLSAPERAILDQALGKGEISVEITVAGGSQIEETQFAGVWRVRHYGEGGALQTEWIEITDVPEIIKSDVADMAAGLKSLRESWA